MRTPSPDAAPGTARRRPVDALISLHGLSSFGLGLSFPYTAIYLSDRPGLGTAGVALYFACTGGANLAVALLMSARVIRLPTVTVGVLGTLLWCAGYLTLPLAGTPPVAALAGLLVGIGQGGFMAVLIPLVNGLITPEERRPVFARRYAVLNATLAAGSLVSGLLTLVLPRTVIPWFFVANAVLILPLTAAIVVAGRRQREPSDVDTGDAEGSLPLLGLWKLALPAVAFQLVVYLLGLSQFEATAPLVTDKLLDMGLFVVSAMLLANVLVIVFGQRVVTRVMKRYSETTGLRIAVGIWIGGFVVAGLCAFGPYEVRLAGLLAYAMLFAVGECAYSCSFHPWLISLVPDRDLTRANAATNSMMGVGNLAGPSIGVALVLSGNASVVWFGLAGSLAVAGALCLALAGSRLSRARTGGSLAA